MRRGTALLAFSLPFGLLAAATAAQAMSEFGIEGMGVVSTPANEGRASVSADGRRIVWSSTDRPGGTGGADLWQATLREGRWQDARPLGINSAADDVDPMFSADGRWLYFVSDREGGAGGDDLYRAAVPGDGHGQREGDFGPVRSLGVGVNGKGDEQSPVPSGDGRTLLFASDGFGAVGGLDLFAARWDGTAFTAPRPLPGINTVGDEAGGAWLGDGATVVYARSDDAGGQSFQLFVAHCDGRRYAAAAPLRLSFNQPGARTLGPGLDWNRPGELLVSGAARSPRAGQLDIYRIRAPALAGKPGCR